MEEKYGPQRGYTDYKYMAELNDEKWRIVGEIWLGDDFVKKINDRILEENREPVYDMKRDSPQGIDPEKNGMGKLKSPLMPTAISREEADYLMEKQKIQTARELPDNAPSKVLYESYAQQVGNRQGAGNLQGNDNEIIKEMVRDGRSTQRIKDCMRHSPALEGKSGAERTAYGHKKVQEVLKDPQMREVTKTREKGLAR